MLLCAGLIRPMQPFCDFQIDTVEMPPSSEGHKYIFVMTDLIGEHGMVELFPSVDKTADAAAHCILNMLGRYGLPRRIVSDQGTEYNNNLVSTLIQFLGADQGFSYPYRPQANGVVERKNKEVKRHLISVVQALRWVQKCIALRSKINKT